MPQGETEQAPARQILTVVQAAELLQVKVKTCRSLAVRGLIPAFKLGHSWRFVKSELEVWALEQARANVRPQPDMTASLPGLRGTPRPAPTSLAARLDAMLATETTKQKGKSSK